MYSKNITRNAVGRVARIGDLYDARTDTFVGFSVLDGAIPDSSIEVTKIPASDINYMNGGTILEKFEELNIVPELRASILANLVSLEGHGKYLDVEWKNKKARKSMMYTIQTENEKLILTPELNKCFAIDALDLDFATHFVVAINWGAITVVTLEEKNNSSGAEREKTENDLKEELQKLGASISEELDAISENHRDVFSVEMFGDFLPSTNLPKNVAGVQKLLKKIPRLVQVANRGKGKPITYILMPISELRDYLNGIIPAEVALSLYLSTNLISEMMKSKQEINDILFKFESHGYCVPVESVRKLMEIKSDIEKQETKLKSQYKDALTAIRTKNVNNFELMDKTYKEKICENLSNKTIAPLMEFDNLLKKIELVDKLKHYGIDYIGSDKSIGLEEIKNSSSKIYILYLHSEVKEMNDDLWNENKLYFLHLFNQCQSLNNTSKFLAIDLDVRPDLAINEKEEGAYICLIINGIVVNSDIYRRYLQDKFTCYAKIRGTHEGHPKPSKRIELKLKCPGSFKSICESTICKWHCFKCKEALSFGFDGFFYCSCGRAPSRKFSFKCNDSRHSTFLSFPYQQLENFLKEIPPLDELNVLILGVTGVGKSTWINAFLNYLAFPSLEEASKNELLSVNSTAFQLTDDNDVTHSIRFGQDENEVLEAGQSATQDVKAHLFSIGNTLLRLIDTPGIGDVRGVEQDKENFKKILNYLSGLKSLNGICILLKPNESRLNVLVEFCVKELLAHLHRNAARNIVFCFTHSRETFYKPGDTRQSLVELLWQNRIDLELTKNTMYCMDNESFRFLCAANQGVEFRDCVKKSFSESWNISVEETNRLISYFKTLEPHTIEDSISLNDARKNIVCLTKPIVDISKNIQQNLALIKDKQELLMKSIASEQDLVKVLYLDIIKLETKPLKHPMTVCGASSCVKYNQAADGCGATIEYVTHCHQNCKEIKGVPINIVGDDRLKRCAAMNGTRNCVKCGCRWDQHLHITYVQNRVIEKIMVQDVQIKITGKQKERQQIEAFIRKIEEIRTQQEDELRKIIEISVKLGRYLSKNAILPYNDVMGRYIDHLIEKEEHKPYIDGNDAVLKRLRAMRAMYDEEVNALTAAMAQPNAEELTFTEFRRQLKELYALPINGAQLQNAIEQASSTSGQ